jgi:hypothetical protein
MFNPPPAHGNTDSPGEEPLNHPSAGVNGEADLIGGLSDDLDRY